MSEAEGRVKLDNAWMDETGGGTEDRLDEGRGGSCWWICLIFESKNDIMELQKIVE